MNPELLATAKNIWDRQKRAERFQARFQMYPIGEGGRIVLDFQRLGESIPLIGKPANMDEVYQMELRRRSLGEALWLEHSLSGRSVTFGDTIKIFGIEGDDINNLRPWLEQNRAPTLESIERVAEASYIDHDVLDLAMDIPGVRRQSEEYLATVVTGYHRKLGRLFENLTNAGGFLRGIDAQPTTSGRSYFNPVTKTLAIDIGAVCYMNADGLPQVKERPLIRLFGHEGFGHGVNAFLTETGDIPFFLKTSSGGTIACLESIAQFYEKQIFADLADSPDTQKELDIAHKYPEILREEQDVRQIETYGLRLFQYGITILADRSHGDPADPDVMRQKIQILSEVSLYPGYAPGFVNNNRHNYDIDGNLALGLMAEIRYAAKPADRAMEELRKKGISYPDQRSKVDDVLLRGYWTPIGLVEKASVA